MSEMFAFRFINTKLMSVKFREEYEVCIFTQNFVNESVFCRDIGNLENGGKDHQEDPSSAYLVKLLLLFLRKNHYVFFFV